MDFYILPFLGSSEFNPRGSCTLDPRALLLLIAPWSTRVTSGKKRGETRRRGSGEGEQGGGRKFREWQIEMARSETGRARRGRRGRKRGDSERLGPP